MTRSCHHHAGAAALHVGRDARRQRLGLRSPKRSLPLLDEWGARHADPDSGVWALTPPCGFGYWELWAPGSADPDADFPYADAEPHALHQAREGENGEDDLAAISGWLTPWLEQVTGARAIDLVEGWSAPYGPVPDREYVIYARDVTIFHTVQVVCDHDHETSAPCPEFVEGFPAEPAGAVRKVASRRGWVCRQGRDYCPNHAESSEGR